MTVMRAIEPVRAFAARVSPLLKIGERGLVAYVGSYRDGASGAASSTDRVVPVMAYPDIKTAMYEPLAGLSSEYFVPNLRLIESQTRSALW